MNDRQAQLMLKLHQKSEKAYRESGQIEQAERAHRQAVLLAETQSSNWLAAANEIKESGGDDASAINKAADWLDILNELEGLS